MGKQDLGKHGHSGTLMIPIIMGAAVGGQTDTRPCRLLWFPRGDCRQFSL